MRVACWLSVFLLAGLAACRPEEPTEPVLARVGDRVITAEAFTMNYEFGYGHLRRGPNPRRAYLDFMIYEKIMAMEAERMGLDTSRVIQRQLRTLREELLVERVFEAKALAQVSVAEDEVRRAIQEDAVSFQLRFLPAMTEQEAEALYEAVKAHGYEEALSEREARYEEEGLTVANLQSPFVRAEDIEPAILAAIQNLEIGVPSRPVEHEGLWYVFEVTNVRREPLAESDYAARASSVRKVLYNEKAMAAGTAFVAATMEPLNVATRREGFEILHAALWEWYRTETPQYNLLAYIEEEGRRTPYVARLRAAYDVPLVSFGEETWTIRAFLEHFTPGRYVLRPDDEMQFKARLADLVALVVRDEVFMQMAQREGLDRDGGFQQTLAQWHDKWRFEELVRHVGSRRSADGALSVADMRALIDSVADRYPVTINEHMLDTLSLTTSTQTVHLFKNNSSKMPFPIVNPAWKPAAGQ